MPAIRLQDLSLATPDGRDNYRRHNPADSETQCRAGLAVTIGAASGRSE